MMMMFRGQRRILALFFSFLSRRRHRSSAKRVAWLLGWRGGGVADQQDVLSWSKQDRFTSNDFMEPRSILDRSKGNVDQLELVGTTPTG
jgi:hypothetical protein